MQIPIKKKRRFRFREKLIRVHPAFPRKVTEHLGEPFPPAVVIEGVAGMAELLMAAV